MRTVTACDKYDSYASLCTLKLAVSSLANKKSLFSLLACFASTHARFKVTHLFNKITCAVAGREYQSPLALQGY